MVKINQLEIENVKRIKAVKIEPAQNGLTVIGGRNGQGKTSVLDSIAWALGGEKYRPSQAKRSDSVIPPMLHVELSNGLIVERKGKNSDLKVTDPSGRRGGQQLLNEFVSQLAIDLPKFLNASSKEKADILLRIIGVGDTLARLDSEEEQLYNKRHAIGQIADRKAKYAAELPSYPGRPQEIISVAELLQRQQAILAKNGENALLRRRRDDIAAECERIEKDIADTQAHLDALQTKYTRLLSDLETAKKTVAELHDESTEELERDIADIELVNTQIRANLDRQKAEDEAAHYREEYKNITEQIEDIRNRRRTLLDGADLPLEGLSVDKGELVYNGCKWDCMSGAEQLKIATAIVRRLNPECGFVLLDKLEQMDMETLAEFGEWLESEGLQAIATRVSTGEECSIIIEDGTARLEKPQIWTKGVF